MLCRTVGLPSAETVLAAARTATGRRSGGVDRGALHVATEAVIADEMLNVPSAVRVLEGDISAPHLLRRAPHNLKGFSADCVWYLKYVVLCVPPVSNVPYVPDSQCFHSLPRCREESL